MASDPTGLPVNVGWYADALVVAAVRYALERQGPVVARVAEAASGMLSHMSTRHIEALERDLFLGFSCRVREPEEARAWRVLQQRMYDVLRDRAAAETAAETATEDDDE